MFKGRHDANPSFSQQAGLLAEVGLLPSFHRRKQPLLFTDMLPEGFRMSVKRLD